MNYVCRTQKPKINVPLTRYDFGWMLLCIGMAIGAGTVVVPIQIGLKGLWVFITAFLISYPATYFLQDLYMKTLSVSNDCEDYTNIITQYLGKNWGMILGVIYFLMITHGVFIYSISAIYDSASYLKTYGITSTLLSHSFIYRLIIFAILVLIASYGEKLLFKISGPMVVVKIAIILLLGFIMIPRWNFSNIMALTNFGSFFRDVLLTIPFCFFSTVFVQILNPMNIAYRKLEADPLIATYRAIRAHRLAYITLMIIILFFSLSFTFTLSHEQAVSAFKQNISALALAAEVIPGIWIQIMSTMLNVFAVVTAFLGIYLGFSEAIKGILINLLHRFLPKERINHTYLNIGIYIFIVLLLTVWVSLGASIVNFFQIGSPLYGIVSCLIPCYLVFKVKKLHKFKGIKIWCIFIFGILLVISPFLIFFENTI